MQPVSVISGTTPATNLDPAHTRQLLPATANWDAILAQERALAQQYLSARGISPTSQTATATASPAWQPSLRAQLLATEAASQSQLGATENRPLPLSDFLSQPGILRRANVEFDPNEQRWTATWQKPGPFDFGTVLKPALGKQLSEGENYSIMTSGMPATLSKDPSGELWIEQNQQKRALGSSDLRSLLDNQISSDDMALSLDGRGNLVVEAHGAKAIQLAALKK